MPCQTTPRHATPRCAVMRRTAPRRAVLRPSTCLPAAPRCARFAGGKLITVFSATNYCNKWANAGAILLIGKALEVRAPRHATRRSTAAMPPSHLLQALSP
eukprot:26456-Prymnesium_polylepis.1